jgi:3D (Asp-Asp-Asp) domain-containing protein
MKRQKDELKENKMRKAITIAILGCMLGGGAAGYAQDKTSSEKTKSEADVAAEREKPVHAYRLDFSVTEMEEGKKINSRQYSLNLNADDANEIKIGTRVPVEAGHEQFQYMDVGTSIWCRIGERPDGIPMSVRADISNFAIPDQGTGHESRPVVRQFKINASTLAIPGKPMVVGSVDDPNSKRQFQLEVTVTKLR